jgi:hypothetical protein
LLCSAYKKSWVFAIGGMKASSSHILCCSQQPKKKKKKLVTFFWVTGILFGWEEISISRVDDSQGMREKNLSFVNYRVDDTPWGMIERLEFFQPENFTVVGWLCHQPHH